MSYSRPLRRSRIGNPAQDRKAFSRTADSTHGLNISSGRPMRGGIRL